LKWQVRMLGDSKCVCGLNDLLRMCHPASLSLSLSLSLSICTLLSLYCSLSPLFYCITMESSSPLSSSFRVGAGARRPPLLLLRSFRAGREALTGGGPSEEEEWEEEEGRGATVALALLFIPSWRPWLCGCVETTKSLWVKFSF